MLSDSEGKLLHKGLCGLRLFDYSATSLVLTFGANHPTRPTLPQPASHYLVVNMVATLFRSKARQSIAKLPTRAATMSATRGKHTLPPLPYAYDVSQSHQLGAQRRAATCLLAGARAVHLVRDHDAPPHQASPDLRQWPERRRGVARQVPGER